MRRNFLNGKLEFDPVNDMAKTYLNDVKERNSFFSLWLLSAIARRHATVTAESDPAEAKEAAQIATEYEKKAFAAGYEATDKQRQELRLFHLRFG